MQIIFTERFKKKFKKLPIHIRNKFKIRLSLFIKNPLESCLRAHPLKGNLVGFRAFPVTGDYRVIYRLVDRDTIKLFLLHQNRARRSLDHFLINGEIFGFGH